MSVDRLPPQVPSIPPAEPVNVVPASFPRVFVSGTPGDDALRASIPVFRLMPDEPRLCARCLLLRDELGRCSGCVVKARR